MPQSRTRYVGMDVHQASIAVAYVANASGAEVVSLGTIGTRQCALDRLIRKLRSKSQHLVCVSAAGPCGSWRSRDLTPVSGTQVADAAIRDLRRARELAAFMWAIAQQVPVTP